MKDNVNVILIMVDQMRYDCISYNNNPLISTPNLDMMASQGYSFRNAYSSTPTCIPARCALMTGLSQEHHGRVGYEDGVPWNYPNTLARDFTKMGYQTECIGKMHVYPERNRLGFEHVLLHDGYMHYSRNHQKTYHEQFENIDDYLTWFKEKKGHNADLTDCGLECNSWVARPWMYEEELHPTNWVVTKGIEFLRTRDRSVPFFLNLSFTRPHSPLDPPAYYFDMYLDMIDQIPNFPVGKWADKLFNEPTYLTNATRGKIKEKELKRAIAAYYGSITHIDNQIGRFLMACQEHGLDKNTIFIFTSDHGDQLGEHNLFRKAYSYQGSIHIPLIIYDPGNLLKGQNKCIDEIVELRDIYPSLIDFIQDKEITYVDGKSFKPCLFDDKYQLREYLHGEHAFGEYSSHYILTKEWKYIWYPQKNIEQLFNLKIDPNELNDEADNPKYEQELQKLRSILISELKDREEGFVKDGKLQTMHDLPNTLSFLK
ncbi:MAG: arylsulfatase [Erysipelotrichaceae bacterium]|nr:arylsulfatase [Erysipelotrichaceae bacterium]MDY5251604.1 arylsulfatase [Erysipelotrichaceae bacterium]